MRTLDVASLIDRRPVGRFQVGVFLTSLAIALLDGLDLQAMGLAAPAIARDWGVRPESFGAVFSAAPAGMVVGAFTMGALADHWGRKRLVVFATLLFGLGTALTPMAPTLTAMAALRFLTGLGLGGVLPNLISLVTEFAPARLRATLVTLAFSGLPFGSMLAGLVGRWLIPEYGWPALFYFGGLVPVAVALLAAWRLPESLRFLVAHGGRRAQAVHILRQVAPDERFDEELVLTVPESSGARVSPARLFGPGRTPMTALLALVVALNLFMLYFTLNWLPTLLGRAGVSAERALLATVVLNVGGGLGSITWGLLIDRFGGFPVMAASGIVASMALAMLGVGPSYPALLVPALFVAGACIMGGMPGLYAVIASVYPTTIRSTGVGTVLAVGRIGSVLGPAAGGLLLALEWSLAAIFVAMATPGLLWAAGMWMAPRLRRDFV
jgi:AAHS family 4-hydroxybenzoate transporter-like MFS transporter